MFIDTKFLGVGVKNVRNFCKDERYLVNDLSCSTHPHNYFIQALSETGIIGFLFLISALIYFCKYTIKHLFFKLKGKDYFNDFEICLLSTIAIYLWPFIPSANLFNNWINIVMILGLPFLIWSRNTIKI